MLKPQHSIPQLVGVFETAGGATAYEARALVLYTLRDTTLVNVWSGLLFEGSYSSPGTAFEERSNIQFDATGNLVRRARRDPVQYDETKHAWIPRGQATSRQEVSVWNDVREVFERR